MCALLVLVLFPAKGNHLFVAPHVAKRGGAGEKKKKKKGGGRSRQEMGPVMRFTGTAGGRIDSPLCASLIWEEGGEGKKSAAILLAFSAVCIKHCTSPTSPFL